MVDVESITAIATDVWSTVLDRELAPLPPTEALQPTPTLEGVVAITGGWCGAVILRVSRPLAADIARRMFDLENTDPSLEDMQDAVGELTNTTGGNIKGLMEGLCHLSLPTVVEGRDFRVRLPGARVVTEVAFACDNEPVVVQIVAAGTQSR